MGEFVHIVCTRYLSLATRLAVSLTLRTSVLRNIQAAFGRAGLRIGFDHPVRNSPKLFAVKAAELRVKTIIDIGANFGQFAQDLRRYRYEGPIVSFEPLTEAHTTLEALAKRDPQWRIGPKVALGCENGFAEINVARNLASSSLLPVRSRSLEAAADTASDARERVELRRLDDVADAGWQAPFGLKLDTQGFELQVLRGAPKVLADTAVVLCEMSLTPLYDGGAEFLELFEFLEQRGFRCISLVQGFADHVRHELLQVDGIFVRK
jgi:FkbM family methyltransferase